MASRMKKSALAHDPASGLGDKNLVVICPRCGFEYCHPVEVKVSGDRIVTVRNGEITDRDGKEYTKNARGVCIDVSFEAECGHTFVVSYDFRKGTTYRGVAVGDDLEDGDACQTIWRD